MGQALCVNSYVSFYARHFLSRIISLLSGGIRVLYALGINYAEAGQFFPAKSDAGLTNRFFLRPAQEGLADRYYPSETTADSTRGLYAIWGNRSAAYAIGNRFSIYTVHHRKHRTSPPRVALYVS